MRRSIIKSSVVGFVMSAGLLLSASAAAPAREDLGQPPERTIEYTVTVILEGYAGYNLDAIALNDGNESIHMHDDVGSIRYMYCVDDSCTFLRDYSGSDYGAIAWDINNSGTIVGGASSSGWKHTAWFDGDYLTPVALQSGWLRHCAHGVNEAEQIVGANAGDAYLWEAGVVTVLPRPAGAASATAWAINEAGNIVGQTESDAVMWEATTHTPVVLPAPTPGETCAAYDINNEGTILGSCGSSTVYWDAGGVHVLSAPVPYSSLYYGINDAGTIVANNYRCENDVCIDLGNVTPSGPADFMRAADINSWGQIIALGCEYWVNPPYSCDEYAAIRLDPIAFDIESSVPAGETIDARIPHAVSDPGTVYGWDSVELTFDGIVSEFTAGEFAVAEDGGSGSVPTVAGLTVVTPITIAVQLSEPIEAGAWTTITHTPTGASVRLGSLPGDVDGSGTVTANDILAVIDYVNDALAGGTPAMHQGDIDRSGNVGLTDILMLIDLINGSGFSQAWLGAQLP